MVNRRTPAQIRRELATAARALMVHGPRSRIGRAMTLRHEALKLELALCAYGADAWGAAAFKTGAL
jgi:hypothetical protein